MNRICPSSQSRKHRSTHLSIHEKPARPSTSQAGRKRCEPSTNRTHPTTHARTLKTVKAPEKPPRPPTSKFRARPFPCVMTQQSLALKSSRPFAYNIRPSEKPPNFMGSPSNESSKSYTPYTYYTYTAFNSRSIPSLRPRKPISPTAESSRPVSSKYRFPRRIPHGRKDKSTSPPPTTRKLGILDKSTSPPPRTLSKKANTEQQRSTKEKDEQITPQEYFEEIRDLLKSLTTQLMEKEDNLQSLTKLLSERLVRLPVKENSSPSSSSIISQVQKRGHRSKLKERFSFKEKEDKSDQHKKNRSERKEVALAEKRSNAKRVLHGQCKDPVESQRVKGRLDQNSIKSERSSFSGHSGESERFSGHSGESERYSGHSGESETERYIGKKKAREAYSNDMENETNRNKRKMKKRETPMSQDQEKNYNEDNRKERKRRREAHRRKGSRWIKGIQWKKLKK